MTTDRDAQRRYDNRQEPDPEERNWRETRQAPIMKVCAWCKEILQEGEEPASHGICDDCAREMKSEMP